MTLAEAVQIAVAAKSADPRDTATIALAIGYADAIDSDPDMMVKAGPLLLAALESLGLSPRARAALVRGAHRGDDQPASPLDELRQRRAQRRPG